MKRLEQINEYIEKNNIYKDKRFQKIMEIDDVEIVNHELLRYSMIYVDRFKFKSRVLKFKLVHKLKDGFMIYYIDKRNEKSNGYYEDFLIKYGDLFDNIFEYLMNKDLDMKHIGVDTNNVSWILRDSLALNTKKKKNKILVMDKLKKDDKFIFSNSYLGVDTDLLLMNIEVGNYDEALKLLDIGNFNNDNYFKKLLFIMSQNKDNDNLQELFLMNVIDSGKIKVLNIDSVSFINKMLNRDSYQRFNDYLDNVVDNDMLFLYKNVNNEKVFLSYEEAFSDNNILLKKHFGKKLIRSLMKRKNDIT